MSKTSGAQYVVLCEDLQAQVFIRRVLIHAGANRRRIRFVALPATVAGGAGHAYVKGRYPAEVRAVRVKNACVATCLVVHIDADDQSVAYRHAELAAALKADAEQRNNDGKPRGAEERIAELVPKRNIETWIYALDESLHAKSGEAVTEEKTYRKFDLESQCARAAEAFAESVKTNTEPPMASAVPSLRDGVAELRRCL